MKITFHKSIKAFMMVEAIVAMSLFGICAVAIINGFLLGFHQIQSARHQNFAKNVIVDKTEIIRLPYCRLNDTEVISRYDATTNETYTINQPDMTYFVRVYTEPFNSPVENPSYTKDIKIVHIKIFWWETSGRRIERIWTTYVIKDSILEKFVGGIM